MRTARRITAVAVIVLASIGLHVQSAAARTLVKDTAVSCTDGHGHTGWVSYTAYKGLTPNLNYVWMTFASDKATGGGYYRIETYRFSVAANGEASGAFSIGPDQDRPVDNFYRTTNSIVVTEGSEAWLSNPAATGAQFKYAVYTFHFLFSRTKTSSFTSGCDAVVHG